jgi:hypothetical protein
MCLLQIVVVILGEESHSMRAETALGSSSLTDGTDKPKVRLIQNGGNELRLVPVPIQLDDTGRMFRGLFVSGTPRFEL